MPVRKKLASFILLSVFAAACVLCASSCGTRFKKMKDGDAADLYAALIRTCEYEGSFTVACAVSEVYEESSWGYDQTYDSSEEYSVAYTFSYDEVSRYLVCMNDYSEIYTEDGEDSTYRNSEYEYFVPETDGTLTHYSYDYLMYEGGADESKTKTAGVPYSDSGYRYWSDFSHIMNALTDFGDLDKNETWTSVEDLCTDLFYGLDSVAEVGKNGKDTVYRISMSAYQPDSGVDNDGIYIEVIDLTESYDFYVSPDGYLTKYVFTANFEEGDLSGANYDGDKRTFTWDVDISYSFDDALKLSEKEMNGYTSV